jgi:ADP-heptose:LPS heptosyltransferase/GT2 family glycosyltransferase
MDVGIPAYTDAPAFLVEIEQPLSNATLFAGSQVGGHGWVLGPEPVCSITVHLGDMLLCHATLGLNRADVAHEHPGHPHSAHAGFRFAFTLPGDRLGAASLRFDIVTASRAHVRHLPVMLVAESLADPDAPSLIEEPEPLRIHIEDAQVDRAGILHVRGWAVGLQPIEAVRVNCNSQLAGLAQTMLPRADVARALAIYPDAGIAGFRFDGRISLAEDASTATVEIIAEDASGQTRSAEVAVAMPPKHMAVASVLPPAMLATIEDASVSERGVLRVRGWAVSLSALDTVQVFIDRHYLGTAEASMRRDDVGAAHPEYPNSGSAGFLFQQEIPDGLPSDACVNVIITAVGSIRRELTAPLVLPHVIRRTQNSDLVHFFLDSISLTGDGLLSGDGWAVCPSGIERIDLLLGERHAGQADIGHERPDVGNRFPSIPSARTSGFRFSTRVQDRIEGEHILQVRITSRAGDEHTVLQPICALHHQDGEEAQPAPSADLDHIKFYLDTPAVQHGQAVESARGFLVINGWAFARTGIAAIEVFVDGQSQGHAYYGIRREEVQTAFPNSDALLSGFAMLIPPQVMKKGRHDIQIVVRDKTGHVQEHAFSVQAEPMAEGPGPWRLRRKVPQSEIDLHEALLCAAGWSPAWTLLLPLTRTTQRDIDLVRETLASLRYQAYQSWRILLAIPAAANPAAVSALILAELDDLAPNVDIVSIADATELAGLIAADGMFAVLSPGDTLGEDALLELTVEAATHGRPDFLYSDERRYDPADGALKAFFKPDWSPDLLLSTNYIGRLWAVSPDLLRAAGLRFGDLVRLGEYDAILRLTEAATRIVRVTKVLCARGRRQFESPASERQALERAARRRGIAAEVLPGCIRGTWRFKRHVRNAGMVSIIMPTIASKGLVKVTIESIRAKTSWPDYEIIVLDNIPDTDDPQAQYWKGWLRDNADSVIEIGERFNWSRFNNVGAMQARGDFLLFLNDDIEILDGQWLHALMEHAQRPEIGVVGPQLLYPDGTVQHAGVFLSRTVGRHAFRFYPRHEPGPFGLALTQRNVISVTGACMLTRREVFDELGGFDEAHSVINNDLDFSLRVRRSGRLVVYTPHATMIHHEMVSRSKLADTYANEHFDSQWKDLFLQGDPYFHPTLSVDYDDYLAEPEPTRQFQVGHPLASRDKVLRILAVKVDHIGDFIAAFPAFRRIKQHFPQAELVVLAAKASLSLASLEPAIDRVIEFNFFHARSERGRRELARRELLRLQKLLAPMRFDLAIDLRRQADTRIILQHTGARWLAGFDQDYGAKFLDISVEFEGDVARNFKRSHVSDSLIQLVDTVGAACDSDRKGVLSPMPASAARAHLASLPAIEPFAGALFARPVVAVHTGAGAVNKQWPASSFAGLIDMLVSHEPVNVAVIGGPDEAEFAGEVLSQVRRQEHVFCLVGKTSLRDLPIALLACDLYIGNDSGPKHMAASLGVPTIGIHSGSVDAGEWGPMGTHSLTLRRDMTCGPCYIALAVDCPRSLACLHGLAVGDVYNACRRMLVLRRKNVPV